MKKQQLKKEDVLQLIKEESYVLARKKEIYGVVKQINEELQELSKLGLGKIGLQERAFPLGGYGFKDGNSGTGFVNPQNISYVAQLEKEMGEEPKAEETIIVADPMSEKPMVDFDEPKPMVDFDEPKPMVDQDIKQQLIDMKEKIEMLLNSVN